MISPGHALVLAVICLLAFTVSAWADTEDGGSGLVRVDNAYSRPFGRPLINVWGGYFNQDVVTENARYFTFVPGLTLGLGLGFEASAAVGLDGLTTTDELGTFDRRFDVRAGDFTSKLRYTTRLFTDRVRFGAQGIIDADVGENQRPGGTQDPKQPFDPGLVGLLSLDFGIKKVQLRLSGNGGIWKSRNDGAVYFRDFPVAITVPGLDPDDNDVWMGGLALEAGLRSATLFAEATTEQIVKGADYMRFREGYLRLTPGVRFGLSKTIAMNAAVSVDLSSDDAKTEFNPKDVYADAEVRLGFSFGQTFDQASHEEQGTSIAAAPQNADNELLLEEQVRDLDNRIRFLDMGMRLQDLEHRIGPEAPADSLRTALLAEGAPASSTGYQEELRQLRTEYDALTVQLQAAGMGAATATTAAAGTALVAGSIPVAAAASTGEKKRVQDSQPQKEGADREPGSESKQSASSRDSGSGASDEAANEAGKAVAAAAAAAGLVAGVLSGDDDAPPPEPAAGTESVPAAPVESTTQAVSTAAPTATAAATSAAAVGVVAGTAVTTAAASAEPVASIPDSSRHVAAAPQLVAAPPHPRRIPSQAGAVQLLDGIDLGGDTSPLVSANSRAVLDEIADDLRAWPDAEILLMVHAGPAAKAGEAERTEEQAAQLRDYLLLAGAGEGQVRALGLGRSVPISGASGTPLPTARVEVARIR
jgi:hypothetical protein